MNYRIILEDALSSYLHVNSWGPAYCMQGFGIRTRAGGGRQRAEGTENAESF